MTYSHRQNAPLYLLLLLPALGPLIAAWFVRAHHPASMALLVGLALLLAILSLGFKFLEVRDAGDHLELRYGPVPIFRRRIPYAQIISAAAARSTIKDGWGIHYMPGRGWTYNLWGYGCVDVRFGSKAARIGTDDPEGLAAFLNARIGAN